MLVSAGRSDERLGIGGGLDGNDRRVVEDPLADAVNTDSGVASGEGGTNVTNPSTGAAGGGRGAVT